MFREMTQEEREERMEIKREHIENLYEEVDIDEQ